MNSKMKKTLTVIVAAVILAGCSTKKELAYINNLTEGKAKESFLMDIPHYKVRPMDVLYISAKKQNADGTLTDILSGNQMSSQSNFMQNEATQYISGFTVDTAGIITMPLMGKVKVAGENIYEIRDHLQTKVDSLFRNIYVDVRFLSFRFTVLGEVKAPGGYMNYRDQLNILEAVGDAGGITDIGDKKNILILRPEGDSTVTYKVNMLDKSLLSSPAYFLLPNDVVIVQPGRKKVFNVNLATYTFIVSTIASAITSTVLLVNYINK